MDQEQVIEGFGKVLRELAEVQSSKIEEYGISRYEEKDEKANMLLLFNDVHRKYIRLRHQTLDHVLKKDGPLDMPAIRESCADLANYGAMGVQLVDIYNYGYIETRFGGLSNNSVEVLPLTTQSLLGIEQIALINDSGNSLYHGLSLLGAKEWSHDVVTTLARVGNDAPAEQQAILHFNYEVIPGKELELIHYTSGTNWLERAKARSGLSHMGMHVNSIDGASIMLYNAVGKELEIAQEAVTMSHTNPIIKDTRRYRYRIFNTRKLLGFDLKFIERRYIQPGDRGIMWSKDPQLSWMTVEL